MKVYHYNSSTGAFIGTSEADPNPRRPGSFLIPAFATEMAPLNASKKQFNFWNGSEWELKNILKPEVVENPKTPEPTWERIRSQRNFFLSQTDWIFAPDVTLNNKEAWLTYRQALRDIPSTFKTPEEVVWPEKP